MTDPSPQNQQTPFETKKWLEELRRQDAFRSYDRWDSITDKLNEAAIKVSETALRTAILINGGAAVSVLAFIGSLASKELIKIDRLLAVADSLQIFALGVAFSAFGIVFAYLTHYLSAAEIETYNRGFDHPYVTTSNKTIKLTTSRRIAHVVATLLCCLSLFMFIWGMFSVKYSITHLDFTSSISGNAKSNAGGR